MEEEWLACNSVWDMFGRFDFEASPRKLRLFSVACCRRSRPLLKNTAHRQAVDLAERFADDLATEQELRVVYDQAQELATELRAGKTEREIRRWAEAVAVLCTTSPKIDRAAAETGWQIVRAASRLEVEANLASLLRDIIGNPFRPMTPIRPPDPPWLTPIVLAATGPWTHHLDSWFKPEWITPVTVAIAQQMYESRDFSAMPILADALQEAGCASANVLDHCHSPGPHVRGCWVVDLVLGMQ